MADNFTRTVYGAYLQTCMLENLPYTMAASSTLNEKFGILAGVAPAAGEIPSQQYWAIGNGGHRFENTTAGIPKPVDVIHKSTDAALFNHLPFVLREPNNDLGAVERAKYGLRTTVTYNSVKYIAYYLKRFDLSAVVPKMLYKTIGADGTAAYTDFIPDSSNLNPVPQELSNTGVNVTDGRYVSATALTQVKLDANDIAELQNVANIIYGDPDLAIVSEIAICSGIDKIIDAGGNGQATFNFLEVIAVQVCTFMNVFWLAKYANSELTSDLDVGATEPLQKITVSNS